MAPALRRTASPLRSDFHLAWRPGARHRPAACSRREGVREPSPAPGLPPGHVGPRHPRGCSFSPQRAPPPPAPWKRGRRPRPGAPPAVPGLQSPWKRSTPCTRGLGLVSRMPWAASTEAGAPGSAAQTLLTVFVLALSDSFLLSFLGFFTLLTPLRAACHPFPFTSPLPPSVPPPL